MLLPDRNSGVMFYNIRLQQIPSPCGFFACYSNGVVVNPPQHGPLLGVAVMNLAAPRENIL